MSWNVGILPDEKKEEIDSLTKQAISTAAAKANKDFDLVKKLPFPATDHIVWTNRLSESVFSHMKKSELKNRSFSPKISLGVARV